jgi:hypothetical protein
MFYGKFVLVVYILMYLSFGVMFLFWPVHWTGTMGIKLSTSTAINDIRATYGGFELGMAAFLIYCLLAPQYLRIGLLAAGLSIAGFAIGRVTGLILDRPSGILMPLLFGIEILLIFLAVTGYKFSK